MTKSEQLAVALLLGASMTVGGVLAQPDGEAERLAIEAQQRERNEYERELREAKSERERARIRREYEHKERQRATQQQEKQTGSSPGADGADQPGGGGRRR